MSEKEEPPSNEIQFDKRTGNKHRDTDRSGRTLCGLLARSGTMETGYIRAACLFASREYPFKRLALVNQALG